MQRLLTWNVAVWQIHGPQDTQDIPGEGCVPSVGQARVIQGRRSRPWLNNGGHCAATSWPTLPQQWAGLVDQREGVLDAPRSVVESWMNFVHFFVFVFDFDFFFYWGWGLFGWLKKFFFRALGQGGAAEDYYFLLKIFDKGAYFFPWDESIYVMLREFRESFKDMDWMFEFLPFLISGRKGMRAGVRRWGGDKGACLEVGGGGGIGDEEVFREEL